MMPDKTPLPFPNAGTPPALDEVGRGALFHRLNNQLGIILANAELLESRLQEQDRNRARAAQIVASAIDAISTVQDISARTGR
ncbi:MAG: hypothetical protein OXF27_04265 [Acidobacteria bacterium]|nr:hypothetical protein [Acidobacteriota bacterium]